jgi:F-type H+-transporting ATPase subunit c
MELSFIGWGYIGAGIGAGLAVLGAGLGIGKLAAAALEGSARQPEMAGKLMTTMLIAAALIEGLGLFAIVICFLAGNTLGGFAKSANHPAAPSATHATH